MLVSITFPGPIFCCSTSFLASLPEDFTPRFCCAWYKIHDYCPTFILFSAAWAKNSLSISWSSCGRSWVEDLQHETNTPMLYHIHSFESVHSMCSSTPPLLFPMNCISNYSIASLSALLNISGLPGLCFQQFQISQVSAKYQSQLHFCKPNQNQQILNL